MNKNFTAILLIMFTLPIGEQNFFYYISKLDIPINDYASQLPQDPPSGYVFSSLGSVSSSAVVFSPITAQDIVIGQSTPNELQESYIKVKQIPVEIKNLK